MALDLTSLRGAVAALRAVLSRGDDSELMSRLDSITRDAVRAGVIQHFEFTYELCWKFIKRWIEFNVSPSAVDGVSRRELFRHAAEQRLIDDVDRWMAHHHARNVMSHTYQAAVAHAVYDAAHGFSDDAERLLAALEDRND